MRITKRSLLILCIFLSGCSQKEVVPVDMDCLTILKREFIQQICSSGVEESPFQFDYNIRTVFCSQEFLSLFGAIIVHDRMPHGWQCYEGKNLMKVNNRFQEVTLDHLFTTAGQREFLRQTCENSLKNDPISYFSGKQPLRTVLAQEDIHTFVIDDQSLIVIFQPYTVGCGADGPFVVKISLADLEGHWDQFFDKFFKKVISSHSFTSSGGAENSIESRSFQ